MIMLGNIVETIFACICLYRLRLTDYLIRVDDKRISKQLIYRQLKGTKDDHIHQKTGFKNSIVHS